MLAIDFSPSCLTRHIPFVVLPMWYVLPSTNEFHHLTFSFYIFSGVSVAVNCLVWYMTWRKRAAPGYKNSPLVRILTRDGGAVGAALTRE
jgi:hypothetical protein